MNYNKILRVFMALLVVCCLLVNISPVKARATSLGATALVEGLYGIAAILIALGILPGADQSVFDSLVSDISDRLSSLGFLYDGFIEVMKIVNGTKVNYYVAENLITEVRDYLVETAVVVATAVQPVSTWDVWSSNVPFKPVYFYLQNDSGDLRQYTAFCCSSSCTLTRSDGYTVNLSTYRNGYYWGQLASVSVTSIDENLSYTIWGEYLGTFSVGSNSVNQGWKALNYITVPYATVVDSSFTAGYVPSTAYDVKEVYLGWAEGSVTEPDDEGEDQVFLPVGVGSTYEETITQSQEQVQTGESTYVETQTGTGSTTSSISQSWLGQKLDSLVSSISGFFSDVISTIEAIPGAFSSWFEDVISGLESIPDKILAGIEAIFVPSADFVTAKVEALRARFDFIDVFIDFIELFEAEFSSSSPPRIHVPLNNAEGSYYFGGSVPFLDLSWYSRYKPQGDAIISGFLWALFGWRMFLKLPGIISGVSGSVGSISSRSGRDDE